jgi:hypothetical protein
MHRSDQFFLPTCGMEADIKKDHIRQMAPLGGWESSIADLPNFGRVRTIRSAQSSRQLEQEPKLRQRFSKTGTGIWSKYWIWILFFYLCMGWSEIKTMTIFWSTFVLSIISYNKFELCIAAHFQWQSTILIFFLCFSYGF